MRREFSNRVRLEIVHRAMNAIGQVVCEGCGLILAAKRFEIDHTIPEAMVTDKSAALTAADGKLLGAACCHAGKTVKDVGAIAKAKRIEAKRLGIRKPTSFRKPPPGMRYDWRSGRYVKEARS